MPKKEKPIDLVLRVSHELELLERFPEAYSAEQKDKLLAEAAVAMRHLRDLRCIVRAVADLDQPPRDALEAWIR
jgi:hypothetical protein